MYPSLTIFFTVHLGAMYKLRETVILRQTKFFSKLFLSDNVLHRISLARQDETQHQVSVGFPGETCFDPGRTRSCQNEELRTTTTQIRQERHNVREQSVGGRPQTRCRYGRSIFFGSTRQFIRTYVEYGIFRACFWQSPQSKCLNNTSNNVTHWSIIRGVVDVLKNDN